MNPHKVPRATARHRAKLAIIGDQAEAKIERFAHLPTLAEMNAKPRAVPKFTPTRHVAKAGVQTPLEREREKLRKRAGDRTKLQAWANKVKDRDEWKDRHDGLPVLRTNALCERRGEAHHIVPKADKAVRYDVRNGICLSYDTHARVEANELTIIGTKFFEVDGRRYIDATHRVIFKENK